jgi:hypothetical protein
LQSTMPPGCHALPRRIYVQSQNYPSKLASHDSLPRACSNLMPSGVEGLPQNCLNCVFFRHIPQARS